MSTCDATPFTHTHAPAATLGVPASSNERTVNVTEPPGSTWLALLPRPSVGWAANVTGSKVE